MFSDRIDELVPAANAVPQTAGTRFLAADIMNKRGFNPIEKMIDLAEKMEEIDEDEGDVGRHFDKRLKLYNTLAKFYAPQPKSVDIQVRSEGTFTIQAIDYNSLFHERQGMIPQQVAYRGPQLLDVVEAVLEDDEIAN